jgi:hypothetical protein
MYVIITHAPGITDARHPSRSHPPNSGGTDAAGARFMALHAVGREFPLVSVSAVDASI